MKTIILLTLTLFTQLLSAQVFTEVSPFPFEQVRQSKINFADVDSDGDEDVLISGSLGLNLPSVTKLYLSDGTGNFTEAADTAFAGSSVNVRAVIFSDLNGDDSPDVLLKGFDENINDVIVFYTNDGTGIFTEVTGLSILPTFNGDMAISDVDSDGDADVLVSGWREDSLHVELYINDGFANFTEKANPFFIGVDGGTFDFADIDGDGDEDVLVIGFTNGNPLVTITNLYLNDGLGNFTLVADTPFDDMALGAVAFSDIDLDGDADLLLAGATTASNIRVIKLYRNEGMNNFTEVINTPFIGIGTITFGDVDNDGNEDVFITGWPNNGSFVSAALYINDGAGNFTELSGSSFEGLSGSSAKFSDIDDDGDLDILASGYNGSGPSTKLYVNNLITSTNNSTSTSDFNFAAYPNPSSTPQITIKYISDNYNVLKINILDTGGHLLRTQEIQVSTGQNNLTLDITDLHSGAYFLQIEDGKKRHLQKIIIQ